MTKQHELKVEYIAVGELREAHRNNKKHVDYDVNAIAKSIKRYGMNDPIGIWQGNIIVEGHGRLLACKKLGYDAVPCIRLDHLSDEERREYAVVHNKVAELAEYDLDNLRQEFEELEFGDFSELDFGIDGGGGSENDEEIHWESLSETFIAPPFTFLDAKQGYWRERKRQWLGLGIKSELGRDAGCLPSSIGENYGRKVVETSIFDPVLCELMYKWFCPKGGKIYDCFAGGSVRGIVAAVLGLDYHGIELRKEQVDANRKNAEEMGVSPDWICDDSLNADKYIADDSCDFIFSCPPYADLEVYSDDERDLSNMEYDDFCRVYQDIIATAAKKLKDGRFAVFVVGDIRDKRGFYRNFVDFTKKCFNENGLLTYNEAILADSLSTAPIRAKKSFANRKLVKVHQNVLIFFKGNPKSIKDNFGEIEVLNFEQGE